MAGGAGVGLLFDSVRREVPRLQVDPHFVSSVVREGVELLEISIIRGTVGELLGKAGAGYLWLYVRSSPSGLRLRSPSESVRRWRAGDGGLDTCAAPAVTSGSVMRESTGG